jgi:Tfp pilus assembly protein PilF
LLVAATLAAYWPVLSNGFIWDDDDYVLQNRALRDWNGLWEIWFNPAATPQYYPLVHTIFWLEYHLWGLQPLGFHLVNLLLHALGAVLLWRLLVRIHLPGSWLAAAVFALHPVQVETVAWVTELKNVLSAVLSFGAALFYFRFSGIGEGAGEEQRPWACYFAALGLFIAALLSKTVACSLPAALLLVLWWQRERLRLREVALLGPFFAIGLALGLMTAWLEKHHVGAQGADWALSFGARCLIAGRALWFYAGKLVWPAELTFIYPRWIINPALWWQWLFPAAVLVWVTGLWLARRRIGKGPLVAVLIFAGTLLPALGFINVYPMRFSFVADHFQYFASIGIISLIVGTAVRGLERRAVKREVRAGLAALLLTVLGVLTWRQCGVYHNLETLWTDTLQKNPGCWMAHSNLGRLLAQEGRLGEAEAHYKAALGLNADEEAIHYNYGNLLARTGRLDDAVAQFQEALRLKPEKAETHNNLGGVLNMQHQTDAAIAEFERAIFYKPDYAEAYYNLGSALASEHNTGAAVAAYQRAVRLKPDSELFRKRLQALGAAAN